MRLFHFSVSRQRSYVLQAIQALLTFYWRIECRVCGFAWRCKNGSANVKGGRPGEGASHTYATARLLAGCSGAVHAVCVFASLRMFAGRHVYHQAGPQMGFRPPAVREEACA